MIMPGARSRLDNSKKRRSYGFEVELVAAD
jgi:hypothetical protein